jgi:hypothetical protein
MLRAKEKNTTRSKGNSFDRGKRGEREGGERERMNTIFSPLTIPRPVVYTRVAGVLENMHISTRQQNPNVVETMTNAFCSYIGRVKKTRTFCEKKEP